MFFGENGANVSDRVKKELQCIDALNRNLKNRQQIRERDPRINSSQQQQKKSLSHDTVIEKVQALWFIATYNNHSVKWGFLSKDVHPFARDLNHMSAFDCFSSFVWLLSLSLFWLFIMELKWKIRLEIDDLVFLCLLILHSVEYIFCTDFCSFWESKKR